LAKGGKRAAKAVAHAVAKEERNFIWKAANGIFRPVKTDAFKELEQQAKRRGRTLEDPRAGLPTHGTDQPRITHPQQLEAAKDLGYEPYPNRGNAKQPIFYKPDGHPPYISYDLDGHGSINRTDDWGPGAPPQNVAWKGADDPRQLQQRRRDGTYVPKYDKDGNIYFDDVRG
jgi:hypothetical protein